MKKAFKMVMVAVFLMVAVFAFSGTVKASTKQDKTIVRNYCKRMYKGCKIRFIMGEKLTEKKLTTRAGKNIVYVEVLKTVSYGNYGLCKSADKDLDGDYIKYTQKQRKGKIITVYCVYSPYNNYIDDVTAVVHSGTIR